MTNQSALRNIAASREADSEILRAALVKSVYAMKNAQALIEGELSDQCQKDIEILDAAIELAELTLKQTQT